MPLLSSRLSHFPQYQGVRVHAAARQYTLTHMFVLTLAVGDQMAHSPPTRRQYLPLFSREGTDGIWRQFKVYWMPLDLQYFQGARAFVLAGGSQAVRTHAVLGVHHADQHNPHVPGARSHRIELYGFAEVDHAPNLYRMLSYLPEHYPFAHDLN
ncbi:conserved hypothetical Ustilaginaceae-specific protein [Sporisorium reilianum SRZ2]|uniref:Conserved hypothetical Ustilaginaceae-specific protein n=1 Tax=Sporisorium reilianum (strain SRZ2) TaxID=999809 RepID=E6ZS69_SPORE|nr:conserved hypothetical Ustilaginaceae-specific protein [Sporisorium reilianum SRZ2]